ncbi:MAG: YihY/virulence factor BrkB family protein, partial [Planctomycetes bacterium]|nr:YihY/virulence factor BrkB family protein [Planctomycetota bacterium]
MNQSASQPGLFKATFREFSEDECTSMAAALAYYTALSMPPLLVIIVTVAGWIWGPEAVRGQIQDQVTSVVGQGGWEQIRTMMDNAGKQQSQGVMATAVSVVLLIFTATGVMVQLQAALNKAW